MKDFKGKPSKWLLKNSRGYPDFLFTILTYSMLLLIFVCLNWIIFAILAVRHSNNAETAEIIIMVMDSMKTGLISLAGVIFGLAGSYTVRRYKTDEHHIAKKKIEQPSYPEKSQPKSSVSAQESNKPILNEEDI